VGLPGSLTRSPQLSGVPIVDDSAAPPVESASLCGKSVLLTGASAGLGFCLAGALAQAGARLAVIGRRREPLEVLAARFSGVEPVCGDLSDTASIDAVHRAVVERIGSVDVLINNAAMIVGGVQAEDETIDQILSTLTLNTVAPLRLSQLVMPGMRDKSSGSIVNITSIAAIVGMGRLPQASYAASKGALASVTRELAAQWGRFGIRVNAIAPGFFRSEITQDMYDSDRGRAFMERGAMLKRAGEPKDFVGATLLLAGDAGSFITGQTIVVDGGWSAW
jgi:NAD(P)-dependent dehydrogenase (short-subunit alcohol dehydrogenase family)